MNAQALIDTARTMVAGDKVQAGCVTTSIPQFTKPAA
jgi:hypothetical protein